MRFLTKPYGLALASLTFLVPAQSALTYPEAPSGTQIDQYHGMSVADPYRWLEDLDSPATKTWIEAQRSLLNSQLSTIAGRNAIRARLTTLWDYPKVSLPAKRAGRYFFYKNSGLQNQSLFYVQDTLASEAKVLIDPNTLSADGTVALKITAPSPDGQWLGYGLSSAGSDWVEFRVRSIATGQDTEDVIKWVKFSGLSWTKDGKGFFYARYPEVAAGEKVFSRMVNREVYYHRLGTPQAEDKLVFSLPENPDWNFGMGLTDDGRYLIFSPRQNGRTQNALYYLDLVDPEHPGFDGKVVRLLHEFDANYSLIGSDGETFYLQTNLDALRNKIIAVDLKNPARANWRTVVPELPDNMDSANYFGGRLVVTTLHDVQPRILVYGTDGKALGEIKLPGLGALGVLSGRDDETEMFYAYSSFLTPPTIFRHDLATEKSEIFTVIKTEFDASAFVTEQVFYPSKDGTKIPMFITRRRDAKFDGTAPLWLYGYGGFNINLLPQFSIPPLVWIEMGGIYVQVNLRGGGEYGEAWHVAGTKEKKQNVFDDYIAAADWLVKARYTSRDRLVLQGRSNGGLLVGAVINQRPDLAAVAFPQVGVMDMLRYHKFTVGASWASDYGNSDSAEGFSYLRAYSPLHTLKTGADYPAVLVTTGDHDDRVFPAHSYKYAAALQVAVAGKKNPALIRIDSNAGHGGSSGSAPVSKTIAEWTDMFVFAYAHLPADSLKLPETKESVSSKP